MFKKIVCAFIGLGFLAAASARTAEPVNNSDTGRKYLQQAPIRTIIVDPGHGLPDPGAEGKFSTESDITLAIGLKLAQKLRDSLPGVKVLMTRTDRYLPNGLTNPNAANRWRAQFANENHGDLFLCIHVNDGGSIGHSEITGYSTDVYYTGKGKKKKKHTRQIPIVRRWRTPNPVEGTETYIWAVNKNDSKTDFVNNSTNRSEIDSDTTSGEKEDSSYNYFESPEARLAASLRTRKYFDRSRTLATYVEQEFVNQGRPSRGVKQRDSEGIWVLQATAMPSILVETGFIGSEEDYLNSTNGQDQVASAILKAVQRYKQQLEQGSQGLNNSAVQQ